MEKQYLIIIAIILLSFCVKAQDVGFNNFIKEEGYVKFTDTTHLPLLVKRYHHKIETFFNKNHFDKTMIFVKSSSIKTYNGFLDISFMGIDGLKKLRNQKEHNLPPVPGALGKRDGILIINLKSHSIDFQGDE